MEGDIQKNGFHYPSSSDSGSLTTSCTLAVLAAVSLVAIPYIGFFVFLLLITLALGFWRRYLSNLETGNSVIDIGRVD